MKGRGKRGFPFGALFFAMFMLSATGHDSKTTTSATAPTPAAATASSTHTRASTSKPPAWLDGYAVKK